MTRTLADIFLNIYCVFGGSYITHYTIYIVFFSFLLSLCWFLTLFVFAFSYFFFFVFGFCFLPHSTTSIRFGFFSPNFFVLLIFKYILNIYAISMVCSLCWHWYMAVIHRHQLSNSVSRSIFVFFFHADHFCLCSCGIFHLFFFLCRFLVVFFPFANSHKT